jgi:hypothetical protein
VIRNPLDNVAAPCEQNVTAFRQKGGDMPTLLRSSETNGCGATIKLDSGEVVYVSIAQVGVLVRHWDMSGGFFKTLMSNFFGAKLYNESSVYKNAQTAQALTTTFPDQAAELNFSNPVLAAFANAIWNCGSAAEVCTTLNEAAAKAPEHAGKQSPELTVAAVISAYGELLEKYPLSILDTSMLPIPKAKMKVLLKGLYAGGDYPEQENAFEIGFMSLSNFQDGVGARPISRKLLNGDARDNLKANMAILEKLMPWEKLAFAETEILLAEWKRFKAGEPI